MRDFENSLRTLLQKKTDGSPRDIPPPLLKAMEYSLLSPGKRIRPQLVFATQEILSLSTECLTRVAVAIEMLHCFSLIHDDLPCMDDDDVRRGLPTNHKVFGENIALLAGDALVSLPFEVLAEIDAIPATAVLAAIRSVSASIRDVIGGQVLELATLDDPSLLNTQKVHTLKTARLFEACVLAPGHLAQADSGRLAALKQFGQSLGLAFQAWDDLQDQENEDPASLLHFMEPKQVRDGARLQLKSSMEALTVQFGQKSQALQKIAQTIMDSLNHD